MNWMTSIINWLKSIEDYFYNAYSEVYGWVTPFWYLSIPLLYASRGFGWLAYYFSSGNQWLYDANIKLGQLLNWSAIWSLIKSYIPNWDKIGSWFSSWTTIVSDTISSWWSATSTNVLSWISIATQGLAELKVAWSNFWNITFPGWTSSLDSLKSAWDSFWIINYPKLLKIVDLEDWWQSRLLDIQSLVNTAIVNITPAVEGWQELRNQVTEFFTNPWEWLEKKFTDWFLGAE